MRMTVGGCEANLSGRVFAEGGDELVANNFDDLLGGGSAVRTSVPTAFSRMCSIVVDNAQLTSASRRATRISRRASAMFSSVSVPWPRRDLKARWSLSVRFQTWSILVYREGGVGCGSGQ